MNRTQHHPRLFLTSLALLAALFSPSACQAQYMYLDTNGDGIHTDADAVNPNGPTHVDVWLDTNHDRDGSLQTCNSHTGAPHTWSGSPPDPGLDIFSYDIFLTVTRGVVVWGGYDDSVGFHKLPNGDDVASGSQIHITRFADIGDERSAGRYKLGSMTLSVGAGTPSIQFAPMVGWDFTSFGTDCAATQEFSNSYVYGVDWFDADGILYGGTINHEPTLAQPGSILAVENHTADETLTANDEDGQLLSFSILSGPDYVTVSTVNSGAGQASGLVHVAPASADIGTASATVRVSDGIFWCDRTIPVSVQRELAVQGQPNITVTTGTAFSRYLGADNPLGYNLTYYVASGPPFVTVQAGNYGTQLRFAPTVQDLGVWNVTYGVTNGTIRDEKSLSVEVLREGANTTPVAILSAPSEGIAGRPVALDGSRSSDPNGDRISFAWDFGDGTPGLTGILAEHRYASEGDYTVGLTVHDPDLFAVATKTVHIAPFAPASAYLAGGTGAIFAGTASTVSVRVQAAGGAFSGGEISADALSSFHLSRDSGGEITAIGCDTGINPDGTLVRGILFAASEVASLLGDYRRGETAALTIRGPLSGGGRFSAPLTMRILRHGGVLSAGTSPNPLNPVGQLSFVTSRPGPADVKIFDVSGRLAHHPIDQGRLPAGYHEVTVGHGSSGEALPSGIYYYRIETPEGVARGRFAIVR